MRSQASRRASRSPFRLSENRATARSAGASCSAPVTSVHSQHTWLSNGSRWGASKETAGMEEERVVSVSPSSHRADPSASAHVATRSSVATASQSSADLADSRAVGSAAAQRWAARRSEACSGARR